MVPDHSARENASDNENYLSAYGNTKCTPRVNDIKTGFSHKTQFHFGGLTENKCAETSKCKLQPHSLDNELRKFHEEYDINQVKNP